MPAPSRTFDLTTFRGQIEYLTHLGHLQAFSDVNEAESQLTASSMRPQEIFAFRDAVASLQRFSPDLLEDGIFGPKTIAMQLQRRCMCPDIAPAGQELSNARWMIDPVYHYFDDPRRMEMMGEAFADWAQYIPRDFIPWDVNKHARDQLNIKSETGRIDGPGGTLAYSGWLRRPGTATTRMDQTYDRADASTQLMGTMIHEIGHAIGYAVNGGRAAHSSDPASIMYAYMNGTTKVMPVDVKVIQGIYGPRDDTPTSPTDPPPTGDLEARVDRLETRVDAMGRTVVEIENRVDGIADVLGAISRATEDYK